MASNKGSLLSESEYTPNFGEEEEQLDKENKVKHPVAVFFHVAFRAAALLAYILCGWFSSSFITNFVVIVLLLCMDFWTVKNITGRLLVGLRWWNYVNEKGESQWIYESRKGSSGLIKISAAESRLFWLTLIATQLLWSILFFGAVFRFNFKWLMLVIVGFGMNGANLYGYIRCKYGAKKNLSSVASSYLSVQLFKSMVSSKTKASKSATETSQPFSENK